MNFIALGTYETIQLTSFGIISTPKVVAELQGEHILYYFRKLNLKAARASFQPLPEYHYPKSAENTIVFGSLSSFRRLVPKIMREKEIMAGNNWVYVVHFCFF